MKKHLSLLALVLILLLSGSAWADVIPINADNGTWANDQPAGTATINNGGPPRTARWGTDLGSGLSGYDWTPVATPFSVNTGTLFSLGTFNHHNFPIGGTAITGINLDFTMQIDGLSPLAGAFHFTHDETPNAAPCTYPSITPCADAVTVTSPFLNTPFTYLGNPYFFSLLGFSQDLGVTTVAQFITQENQDNVAQLYGTITKTPISTPEPVSLALIGFGLVAVAGLRRFRK